MDHQSTRDPRIDAVLAAAAEEGTVPGREEFPTHCLPPYESGRPGPPRTTRRRSGDTGTVTYRSAATPAGAYTAVLTLA
ncbi:hypothetical protein [Streptomyces sp. NPDC054838]